MLGRAAIGNPWIFQQAKYYLKTGDLLPDPTLDERINVCIEHLKLAVELKGMRSGVLPFRKYYAGYFRGVPHFVQLRNELMLLTELGEIVERLNEYSDRQFQE
jgi:tRNA-dihydrouridine synthase